MSRRITPGSATRDRARAEWAPQVITEVGEIEDVTDTYVFAPVSYSVDRAHRFG